MARVVIELPRGKPIPKLGSSPDCPSGLLQPIRSERPLSYGGNKCTVLLPSRSQARFWCSLQLNSLPEVAAVAMAAAAAVAMAAAAVAMAAAAVAMEAAATARDTAEVTPDFQAGLAEASAETAPDFQVAMPDTCTPLRPVALASRQCLVPGTGQASTGMLTDSIIIAGSSSAATVAITGAVIRFGMATPG